MEQKYTVLLVDDEEEVIEVMMRKIDWDGLGFRVIGSASNGVKALEMAEKCPVDVVMTDIKMPYMDGLELAAALRKEYPSIRILLFTGFDEFEYAREAVHLEVSEYILKPINAEELSRILTRVKTSLDKDFAEKRNVEKLTTYYMESLPLLQANFYTELIEGRLGGNELIHFTKDYQIDLSGPIYCCVVFHTSAHHVPDGMTPLLLSIAVQRQVQGRMDKAWNAKYVSHEGNTVMIAQMDSENSVMPLTDECDRFCRWAARVLDAQVTAGIGTPVSELSRINQSYRGGREAVSYRVLYGSARAINIQEIAPMESGEFSPEDDSDIRALFKAIHLGEENRIRDCSERYIRNLGARTKSVQQYEAAEMELLGNIYRFAAGNHIRLEEQSAGDPEEGSLFDRVRQMDIQTLGDWLLSLSLFFAGSLSSARSSASKSYVEEAQRYVQENYRDKDLSLDGICRKLGVSSSYFSSVFKKETGTSFVGYLTDCRMKHAEQMILEGVEKNYSIADKVGYEDANYFSYVFKKTFGMSPSKYRAVNAGRDKGTQGDG